MDDLVQWLHAQLDEDERIAREADDSLGKMNLDWKYQSEDGLGGKVVSARGADIIYDVAVGVGEHVSAHDPRRVLAEIAAKRRLLDLHHPVEDTEEMQDYCAECDLGRKDYPYFPCTTLRLLAVPYADRPGYREEWRP